MTSKSDEMKKQFSAIWFDLTCINVHFCQQCIGRLQQHAALIGGPNATSCPLCHKMFLGGEALMEHMKHTHKDPNASGVASKCTSILPHTRRFLV